MAILKAVVSTFMDTIEPTDALQITPHFDTGGSGATPQGLADELLAAWTTYLPTRVRPTRQRVVVYNAVGAPPNYPLATAEVNPNSAVASTGNRDISLTLSYFSNFNRPRFRGRLYIPMCVLDIAAGGVQASTTNMQKIGSLATILAGIGANTQWVVYSKTDNAARPVTDWWCDNAWDTQRRRGKKASARETGTVTA